MKKIIGYSIIAALMLGMFSTLLYIIPIKILLCIMGITFFIAGLLHLAVYLISEPETKEEVK